MITTLRIRKDFKEPMEVAIKWYSIISILNDFKWPPLAIKAMAFAAIKGDISSGGRTTAFCNMFNSTKSSLANLISDLYKDKFLVKIGGKTKVNPSLMWDFESGIIAKIHLNGETS